MILEYKGEELKLKYTFNSFRYMEDLNLSDLDNLDEKPFKMFTVAEMLLTGALNHDPREVYDNITVSEIFDAEAEDGNLMELFEFLLMELQESSFFKNLQGKKKLQNVKITSKK